MNLAKCKNGHWYDQDKYGLCPHCGVGAVKFGGNDNDGITEPLDDSFNDKVFSDEEYVDIENIINNCKSINNYIYISPQELACPVVTSVDFYRDSSILKFSVESQIKAGENIIYVLDSRLPADTSRIQLKFSDEIKDVRILGKVKVATSSFDDEKKIKELGEHANKLIDRKKILLHQAKQLSGFLNYKSLQNISIESAIEYLKETEPRLIQDIWDELRTLQRQIDDTKKDIEEIRYANTGENIHNVLAVMISSQVDGGIVFEISYEDTVASWTPYYEISYDSEEKPLTFRLRAKIRRASGYCERWEDVSVRLFNESTRKLRGIPELDPKHLKYFKKDKKAASVIEADAVRSVMPNLPLPSPESILEPSFPTLPMMDPGDSEDQERTFADFDDEIASFEDEEIDFENVDDISDSFTLPGKWTFPEVTGIDKRFSEMTLNIQEFIMSGTYSFYAVPMKSKDVFITAKFQKSDADHLMPCQANIYVHDVMIGNCNIKSRSTSNQFILSLGTDDDLLVSRKQTQNQHSVIEEENIKKDLREYKITLQNRKSQAVTVQLLDQIPISDDNRIEVIQEELSGGTYNSENGEVMWNVDVESKGESVLTLRYYISYKDD